MNTGMDWYQYIEAYNLDQLRAELKAPFEAAMREDEALKAAVATHRAEWEMQELMAENLIRSQIREQFETMGASPGGGGLNWRAKNWKYILTAMVLLIIAVYFVFQASKKTPETPAEISPQNAPVDTTPSAPVPIAQTPPELPAEKAPNAPDRRQLAMASYGIPESLSGVRGQADEDTLVLANKAFFDKKYGIVVNLLAKLPENETQDALSLRAHAYFNAGNYAAASRDFLALEKGGIYRREAEWYGILARLAMPNADLKAIAIELDKIRRQSNHPFAGDAEKLWRTLK
ncbi:MAG: hypothetical protein ACKVT2_18735 [Saprospiraceae bacterium]